MKCENCDKEISRILLDEFSYNGSDNFNLVTFNEVAENAVVFETDHNWVGYELTEEEQIDTIRCPYCNKFPFKNKEIQQYEIVRLVCFRSEDNEN